MRWHPLWTRLQTLVIAHALGVAVIGLARFAVSPVFLPPGACVTGPPSSPWDRLCDWLRSGQKEPLSDLLGRSEVNRFTGTLAGVVVLGLLLGWSTWTMRPIRLHPGVRLRSLMILIAVLPIEWVGGVRVWEMWGRWDRHRGLAEHYATMEEIGDRIAALPPPPQVDRLRAWEERRANAEEATREYARRRAKYERAVWRPWSHVKPESEWFDGY